MSPKIMFGVRMSEETKQRLFKAAQKEHRKASNLAEMILIQWLDQHYPQAPNQLEQQEKSPD